MSSTVQRNTSEFIDELEQIEKALVSITESYQKISTDHREKGIYASWHLSGVRYHMRNIIRDYDSIANTVLDRLNRTPKPPHALMIHTPEVKNLMYEFYAFVNMCRISLDNLKYILFPLFSNGTRNMPKSITKLVSKTTNCPVYERIANTDELMYLIDLRNCIVHYRNFATSDISIISKEGADLTMGDESLKKIMRPMAKGTFRITNESDVVFNIYLPDQIFDKENGKKLLPFTYNEKINIVGESMRFLRHLTFNYMEAFAINVRTQEKIFTFDKNLHKEAVEYRKIAF